MSKDHLERRTYRKSPGRQYGYDYDPLRSQSGQSQGGGSQHGETASRSGALLAQRPDPRRTRQLMRQSILANKRINDEETEPVHFLAETEGAHHPARHSSQDLYARRDNDGYIEDPEDARDLIERVPSRSGRRYQPHSPRFDEPDLPHTSELLPAGEEYEEYIDDPYYQPRPTNDWRDLDIDPQLGIEEPRPRSYTEEYGEDDFLEEEPFMRPSQAAAPHGRGAKPTHQLAPEIEYPAEHGDYDYEYEEEHPSVRPSTGKKKLTRRGLLLGAGLVAAAGVGVTAYEVAPKIPGAVGSATTNLEHQVQEAFNKGMQQGAEQARKEFVTALDNLEGFSLEGAITAARLTRVAYDVFVSPVVKTGSALTGDFLNGMLNSFKAARVWLAGVNQDNATLIAIQKVLESWVGQVSNMPKQLDAITQTDLDGAQAYLRALQRRVEDEKNKLNQPQGQQNQAPAKPAAPTQPTQVPKR